MTPTHYGHMVFPILDPENTPLEELRAEALEAWQAEVTRAGFAPVGTVTFEVTHGVDPRITVRGGAAPMGDVTTVSLRLVAA